MSRVKRVGLATVAANVSDEQVRRCRVSGAISKPALLDAATPRSNIGFTSSVSMRLHRQRMRLICRCRGQAEIGSSGQVCRHVAATGVIFALRRRSQSDAFCTISSARAAALWLERLQKCESLGRVCFALALFQHFSAHFFWPLSVACESDMHSKCARMKRPLARRAALR